MKFVILAAQLFPLMALASDVLIIQKPDGVSCVRPVIDEYGCGFAMFNQCTVRAPYPNCQWKRTTINQHCIRGLNSDPIVAACLKQYSTSPEQRLCQEKIYLCDVRDKVIRATN